ncbi:pyrroline-5-carboxylate reductase 3 [Eucyclogobius newberryi]|uniref:pyrroline-5-carboxylate reductase 3 n=1 Tax=Eucyclogobius newberryi TaxID=166745 RepID=UPI003B5C59FB
MEYGVMKRQHYWDVRETEVFLQILKELDIKACLDGRKVRNGGVFRTAQRRMAAAGFDRTAEQLRVRWKFLKKCYYKSQRDPGGEAKIQGWLRYERAMVSILEFKQSAAADRGVHCVEGNDDMAEEDSDGEHDGDASMLPNAPPEDFARPPRDNSALHLDLIIKMDPETESQLRIGFIGAGNMAFGIAKGILSGGDILPENIKVSAPSIRNFGRFQDMGITGTHSNIELVCGSDIVFVAVKPHLVRDVLNEISIYFTDRHIVVSVAAGVTLETLEELLPESTVVMRLMPNLPCIVQEGALLFSRGSCAKPADGALLCSLLQHCGLVEEGPESWIDIHTGLSGSGVAFVYLFAEALAEGAIKMGMPSSLAHTIASQTVLGAGRLLRDSGKHPAQLRSEVCTPGGTTIYGLHTLEQGGVRASTMSAVESATERARQLGQKSAAKK